MEMRPTILLAVLGSALLLDVMKVNGNPLKFQDKPPMCPYGKCFIDRCQRICECVPNQGNTTCTKDDVAPRDCPKLIPGNCPLGKKYTSPLWDENFVCYCNNDSSQTYECFDLSTKTWANAKQLLNAARKTLSKAQSQKRSEGKMMMRL